MAAGPAGVSVAGMEDDVNLAAGAASKGVDVVSATSLVMGASGLVAFTDVMGMSVLSSTNSLY